MISVTILAKNAEETLEKTLQSVMGFPEVILLDTGSTDQTVTIARRFPQVKVFHAPFEGFGKAHNLATSLASYDWILSLDSDEVLSAELAEEILQKNLDSSLVYSILRRNFFNGKWIRGCSGWHPDWVVRLYHRKATSFDEAKVHEKIRVEGLSVVRLEHSMDHTPYRTFSDFLSKMQSYSTLYAKQYAGKKNSSLGKALLHAWATFLKSYLLKRGFMLGKEGFFISLYNGQSAFYKYIKLHEENQRLRASKLL